MNRRIVKDFCEKLIRKRINIQWACETRVDTLCDENLVKLMSKAGCRLVYLGVESGSQRILDKLNKKITVKQIETAINLCKKYKIKAYCSLITGIPGETYEDYLCTKNLITRLKPYKYHFNVYAGIPGSTLYKNMLENNQYEFMDDLGILYSPGFDVKTRFFTGKDSKSLVDYEFKQRSEFDEKLLDEMYRKRTRLKIKAIIKRFPNPLVNQLRKFISRLF